MKRKESNHPISSRKWAELGGFPADGGKWVAPASSQAGQVGYGSLRNFFLLSGTRGPCFLCRPYRGHPFASSRHFLSKPQTWSSSSPLMSALKVLNEHFFTSETPCLRLECQLLVFLSSGKFRTSQSRTGTPSRLPCASYDLSVQT